MEFEKFDSIPRLNKDAVYTEKIDGTNAAVVIARLGEDTDDSFLKDAVCTVAGDDGWYAVWAQSRKRYITPEDDNFGFAKWVLHNSVWLVEILGVGRHFGEWWGSGIQGGYGLSKGEKRFSLFNVKRWETVLSHEHGHGIVPELYRVPILGVSTFNTGTAQYLIGELRKYGSVASPGFMKPEGVVVFHTASRQLYKAFLENDDIHKWEIPGE